MALMSNPRWTHVFVERTITRTPGRLDGCLAQPGRPECLKLYRVEWLETRMIDGGRRLRYHFRAPDAESVRQAFRSAHTDIDALWTAASADPPA